MRSLTREIGDDGEHVGSARDRLGKAALEAQGGKRAARRDAAVGAAREARKAIGGFLAKPGGERGGGAIDEIADRAQAGAGERGDGLLVAAQRCDGERVEVVFARAVAGERLRRLRRVGDGVTDGDSPLRCKPIEVRRDARFAAEGVTAAGDVERQAVEQVGGDHRRVAVAGVGEAREQPRIGVRIVIGDDQIGHAYARVGQREAGGEAQSASGGIDRDQAYRAALLFDQSEGGGLTIHRGHHPRHPQIVPGGTVPRNRWVWILRRNGCRNKSGMTGKDHSFAAPPSIAGSLPVSGGKSANDAATFSASAIARSTLSPASLATSPSLQPRRISSVTRDPRMHTL